MEECELNLDEISIPETFILHPSYPNPFNPETTISFSIPKYKNVMINIYDLKGSLIKTLINNYFESGNHNIVWNGSGYPSGLYIVKMTSGDYQNSQIITLVK